MEPTRKPSRDIQGVQLLAASKRFGKFDPEKEKSVRTTEVKGNETLKQLKTAWRNYIYADGYTGILSETKDLKCSAQEVEDFSIVLAEFQDEGGFSVKAGHFLSALINNGSDENYVIHTAHLSTSVDNLGYMNTKNVVIKGNAGQSLAYCMEGGSIIVEGDIIGSISFGMKGGSIVVKGNVDRVVGSEMKGGSIIVEGNVGCYVARWMEGGEIHLLGDYESIADDIEGGKIYHKGVLIVDK